MNIVEINAMTDGSTGRIMLQIASCARKNGMKATTFSTSYAGKKYKKLPPAPLGHIYYGSFPENFVHLVLGMVTGYRECFGFFSTWRLIKKIDSLHPDILHFHNLHDSFINLGMLFRYVRKKEIKCVWTLHDCWAFTGQCPHFTLQECDKWKTGCFSCLTYKQYPKTYVDRTREMWKLKKKWFNMPESMIIVTPSVWLKNLAKQSFLNKYEVKVINNGIDLDVFKPTLSDFRERYGINEKKIVLGVSFSWSYQKGLDVFIKLTESLGEDYQVVLVGTDEIIDNQIPSNIISIHRTNSQNELAEIYSAADVLVNPTREENYPTVNMEAIACGTPVITFETGGSPEMLDKTCGIVVKSNDILGLERNIRYICEKRPFTKNACVKHAQSFNMNKKFQEYVDLYKSFAAEKEHE